MLNNFELIFLFHHGYYAKKVLAYPFLFFQMQLSQYRPDFAEFLEQSTVASADGDDSVIIQIIEIKILYLDQILQEVENFGSVLKKKAIPNIVNYRKKKYELIQEQIKFAEESGNAEGIKVLQDELEEVGQSTDKDLLYIYFFGINP